MEIDFREAVKPGEVSNFALAQTFHRRVGFFNPMLSFDVTRALVVPEMAPLGTDKSLSIVLNALSQGMNNIHLEDFVVFPDKSDSNSSAHKMAQGFNAADARSGKDWAAILSKLARLGEPDSKPPLQDAKRDISHLPVNSKEAIEARRVREKIEQGEAFKSKTRHIVERELLRLLYDNRGPVDLKMQKATELLPFYLVDGSRVQKALYEVIDHFGSIGDFTRNGFSVPEAVATRKAMQQMWGQASPKAEIH